MERAGQEETALRHQVFVIIPVLGTGMGSRNAEQWDTA